MNTAFLRRLLEQSGNASDPYERLDDVENKLSDPQLSEDFAAKWEDYVRHHGVGKARNRKVFLIEGSGKTARLVAIDGDGFVEPILESHPQPEPPARAELLLHLFLKADERDAVIGDLLERFAAKHKRFGDRAAHLWFYGEVFRSLWPLAKRTIAKISGVIALGEWIRRHVS